MTSLQALEMKTGLFPDGEVSSKVCFCFVLVFKHDHACGLRIEVGGLASFLGCRGWAEEGQGMVLATGVSSCIL